jgi:hypothetical protein
MRAELLAKMRGHMDKKEMRNAKMEEVARTKAELMERDDPHHTPYREARTNGPQESQVGNTQIQNKLLPKQRSTWNLV